MRVVVSIPSLGVMDKGFERKKEIYVMSFAMDGRPLNTDEEGKVLKTNDTPFIASHNETLPLLVPESVSMARKKNVYVAVSNIFRNVTEENPVSLSGSGIILYPNMNPRGLLALHIVVIESDSDTRDMSRDVPKILEAVPAITNVSSIGQAMNVVIGAVSTVLSRNKDDVLLTHNHSGFDFDRYGVLGEKHQDFSIGNDRVNLTLRVRLNFQGAASDLNFWSNIPGHSAHESRSERNVIESAVDGFHHE